MRKVLHVVRSLELGGAERVVVEYALAHDRSQYEPEVCCVVTGGPLVEVLRRAGVSVHVLERRARFDVGAVLALSRIIRRGGFDVVHNHNLGPVFVGVPAAILGGARAVVRTEHNVCIWNRPGRSFLSRLAALRENAQIGVSHAVRASHVRAGRIPPARFVTVWNGIDDARVGVPDDARAVRRELGVSEDEMVCLSVGSLTFQKNHWSLLEAAQKVLSSGISARFLIVGAGPLELELKERARELGVADRVLFLGERGDVPRILSAADIFVLASSWEGLPITVLEAMAAGVPCVATAVGGVPEAIDNGVNGYLVAPDEPHALARAIVRLASDASARKTMAKRARRTYESAFTAEQMARQTEALYELALSAQTHLAPSERVKIIYLIGQLGYGGAERQLLELVRRLPRRTFEPIVCCLSEPGPIGREMRRAGVRVESFRKRGGALSRCTFELWELIRRERPAILHTYLFSANWRGLIAGRLARVPIVVSSVRNVDIHPNAFLTMFDRVLSGLVDRMTANAESVKEYVSSRHGVDPAKIRVIYNGVAVDEIASAVDSRAAQRRKKGASRGPTVAMIASLTPKKDHATFLEAAVLVQKELPGVRFLAVGDGPLRGELVGKSRAMGLGDSLTFPGATSDPVALLSDIDLSVLTSLKEGCSNVVLESMAASLPVVVTDVGGNREVVADGVTGYIVPAGDAQQVAARIVELLRDEELRRRMGQAGRVRVRELFSVERMVSETTAFYLEMLEERVPALLRWVDAAAAREIAPAGEAGGMRGGVE